MKNEKLYVNHYIQSNGLVETSLLFHASETCYDPDSCNLLSYVSCESKVIPNPEPLKCHSSYQGKCPAIDDVSECKHTNQFVNDRCLFQCVDCGEELGR